MEHHLESNNPFYHGSQVVISKGFNFAEKKGLAGLPWRRRHVT
jgi:hypothetical protein